MYSKGTKSTAEDLNCSMEEAQTIIDSFFNAYPKVKEWINEKETFAKTYGYVENLAGRKRRLPDLLLPKFSVSYINKDQSIPSNFNPLIGAKGIITPEKQNDLITLYQSKINAAKRKIDIDTIVNEAARQGVRIINNGAFIAQAHRQIVNAAIQSAAADITKNAMIKVYNNDELNQLGFKLLITVHDELIGECPEENAERVAKVLSQTMIDSAAELCSVPMKCDAEIEKAWYEGEHASVIQEDFEKLVTKLGDKNAALNQIYETYCECLPEEINQILDIA